MKFVDSLACPMCHRCSAILLRFQACSNGCGRHCDRQLFQAPFRRQAGVWHTADIVARLPGLPASEPPDSNTTQRVLAAVERYAETSPEMTMFGQLILDAMPDPMTL
jgi:hypothetical protein